MSDSKDTRVCMEVPSTKLPGRQIQQTEALDGHLYAAEELVIDAFNLQLFKTFTCQLQQLAAMRNF